MMFGYLFSVYLAITLLSYCKGSNISDQRLCYDPKCSEQISLAKTLLKYIKSYDEGLSFQPGVDVVIYSKSAGSKPELWGAEVGGKRGYVPKDMVREYKVFHPDNTLKYTVPTVMSDEKEEADVEKQEGNAETVQEKPVDVTVIENPSNINSESSNKKTFDVIDGTTFYADTLGLTTPTIHPLVTSSSEMGAPSIESTTTFTATLSDMSTASATQSDMAPISPTTMMAKPEVHETSTETTGRLSDGEGGMVESVLSMMSELVSGGEQGVDNINTVQEVTDKMDEDVHSTDDSHTIETVESSMESEMRPDDSPSNGDSETDDEDDEDDVEDEDEEGGEEDDEDDEEEIDPDGNDENVNKDVGDIDEFNSNVRSMGEVKEETKVGEETESEMVTPRNESSLDTVGSFGSNVVSVTGDTKSTLDDSEGGVSFKKKLEYPDGIGELTSENYTSSQSVSTLNDTTSLQDSSESTDDVILKEKHNEPNTVGLSIENNSVGEAVTDYTTSYSVAQQSDGPTAEMEIPKDERDGTDLIENDYRDISNESKLNIESDDILADSVIKSQEPRTETPKVTTEDTEKGTPDSYILDDRSIHLDNDLTAEIISEDSITTPPTAAFGEHYSDPSVQTEPSNTVSDEYNSNADYSNGELAKTEKVGESKFEPQQALKNVELDISSSFKESESQNEDVITESPNISDPENLLQVSEDSSSGIFSVLFDSLGSGYGFISSIIFGSDNENIEAMEDKEGSSQDISHNAAGKFSDSESGVNQHSHSVDVQNMAAGGDSMYGSSPNSHCKESPETICEELSSNSPSNAILSSEASGQNSDESRSWMSFSAFSIGNDSSGIFNFNVPSYGAVIYSIITGVIVLFFFLGHYFIEGNRRDVVLLAKINALEKELTVSSKECLILKEKLKQFEIKSSDFDDSAEVINSMKSELEKVQNEKLAQELGVTESKVQELEEDLKQVSENLHQRDEEHSKRCAELKELSEIQHNKYLEDVKNKTIETEMALTRCKSLETTLTEVKEMLAVKENEICVLQECLQQLKISNGDDPDKAENQLKDILNFGKLKADLIAVTKERDNLKEKLQGEEDARRLLEDHVKVIREEVEKLRKCHEAAEREKVEAQTRLEVLSSYFKEKETQLQKELGNKEALWVQKHTDASTIMQRMKSLEEEVENYKKEENISNPNVSDSVSLKEAKEISTTHPVKECKEENVSKPNVFVGNSSEKMAKETVGESSEKKGSQNETLKKEILDQERGYKTQLATFEKKAHENWVAARQAERKLEESKQEASQLRNRLTMADKANPTSASQNGDDSKPNLSMIDSNGELSASPLHLGLASNSSVDMLLSDPHPHYLDPNSSPPHVGGGSRLPPPPLMPPPPFPPLPLPPRSPYHHPLSPPLPFMPLPPPDANLYPSSIDGHRPPPLGRMSSPPPAPSPSQSPHLPPNDSRGGEFPSPYRDRGGGGRPSSPSRLYMPPDDRGLAEEWRMGRYCTPPPHPSHPSDFPIPPYPPRPHWEDEPPHPTSSFRPLPTSQRTDSHRELKGRKKFSKIRRFWSTLECAPSESHTQTK